MSTKNLFSYNFNDVQNELSQHVSNKYTFRSDQISILKNENFDKINWSSKNMRRIYFSNCTFYDVNFDATGFTGSIFKNCIFTSNKFTFTIFDECIFDNCEFRNCQFTGVSYCKAEFICTKFFNITMHSCFMTECNLNNGNFEKCTIIDIIWEGAKFNRWKFKEVKLINLNFEFTFFEDVHFEDTFCNHSIYFWRFRIFKINTRQCENILYASRFYK